MTDYSIFCFPSFLLCLWLGVEVARRVVRRTGVPGPGERWTGLAVLALRPWAAWAVFNLMGRWQAERGFGNVRTFPFYAHLWNHDATFWQVGAEHLHTPAFWWWSLVTLLAGAASVAVVQRVIRHEASTSWRTGARVAMLVVLSVVLWTAIACLPGGARPRSDKEPNSYLRVWHSASSTLIYAMPQVRSADDFMRRFVEIQPRLRHTIHALTHPPGATLSLYGIGRLAGAGEGNIRYNDTKARYALGLTVVNALNTAVVFLLGGLLFGSARIGLLAAALWFASPAATVYGTFAQDGVYALFFHLALAGIWTVVSSERPLIGRAVLLGIAFSILTLLTYSWCIVTTVFAVFAIVMGVRERWDRHRVVINGLLPLGVMTLLTSLALAVYRLDYLAAYRVARAYHEEWYRFTGIYQWALALAGGQFEMVLMFGSVAGAVFLALLVSPSRLADVSRQRLFLLVLLAVYALPIVLGPNPLKMETSRCWLWIGAVPLVFVARDLSARPGGAFWMGGAVSASVLTSYLMRLFLDFGI